MSQKKFGNCPGCNKRFELERNGTIKRHVRPGFRTPCVPGHSTLSYPATEYPKGTHQPWRRRNRREY